MALTATLPQAPPPLMNELTSASIASLAKNSLMLLRSTLRPSACLLKGVRPAPFNCNSCLMPDEGITSPK